MVPSRVRPRSPTCGVKGRNACIIGMDAAARLVSYLPSYLTFLIWVIDSYCEVLPRRM